MTDTTTQTLAEFVLARLGERKADVERRGTTAVGHAERCIYEGGYEGTLSCDCDAVARVLAECEAHRRIVEDPLLRDGAAPGWELSVAGERILRALASIYAEHPEFREEWRA